MNLPKENESILEENSDSGVNKWLFCNKKNKIIIN